MWVIKEDKITSDIERNIQKKFTNIPTEGNRISRMIVEVEVDFEILEYQKRVIKASRKKNVKLPHVSNIVKINGFTKNVIRY